MIRDEKEHEARGKYRVIGSLYQNTATIPGEIFRSRSPNRNDL